MGIRRLFYLLSRLARGFPPSLRRREAPAAGPRLSGRAASLRRPAARWLLVGRARPPLWLRLLPGAERLPAGALWSRRGRDGRRADGRGANSRASGASAVTMSGDHPSIVVRSILRFISFSMPFSSLISLSSTSDRAEPSEPARPVR